MSEVSVSGVLAELGRMRLLPVVVIDDVRHAAPLAAALLAGGLPCAEVTLRTPAALEALRILAADPDLLVGAGTVLSPTQAEEAVRAGARFVVTPGWSDAVVERCRVLGVPILPGVATPTEVLRALDAGLDTVKLFPAGLLGGPAAVRALAGPFPGLGVVPTGGIGPDDLRRYLDLPTVLAVGGSWMTAPELLREGRFDEVRTRTEHAVVMVREAR